MKLTDTRNGEIITIQVEGRVDTNTAPEFQNLVLTSFQKVSNVEMDFSACDYVSSAGLRALLLGQKTANAKKGSFKLTHVPEVLMNILKVTGFDKILTIE